MTIQPIEHHIIPLSPSISLAHSITLRFMQCSYLHFLFLSFFFLHSSHSAPVHFTKAKATFTRYLLSPLFRVFFFYRPSSTLSLSLFRPVILVSQKPLSKRRIRSFLLYQSDSPNVDRNHDKKKYIISTWKPMTQLFTTPEISYGNVKIDTYKK